MNFHFIWEALIVLSVGYCLLRISGKKTVGEMTGLEIITLLAMASMIGHAVSGNGLWKTVITLCIFVALLITVQFMSLKINWLEKWLMGKATLVIQNGIIITANLKKLRMSVDQLEARLREKGISSYLDIKTATIEMSGQLGYEWMDHAKPVTMKDLEKFFISTPLPQPQPQPLPSQANSNLFDEVIQNGHQHEIRAELD